MTTDFINIQRDIIVHGDLGYLVDSTSLFGSFRAAVKNGAFDRIASQVTHPRKYIVAIGEVIHRWSTAMVFILIIGTFWYTRKQKSPHAFLFDYATIILFILLFAKSIHSAFHLFALPFILFFVHFPLKRKYIMMHVVGITTLIMTHFWNVLPITPFWTIGVWKMPTLGLFILFFLALFLRYRPTAFMTHHKKIS